MDETTKLPCPDCASADVRKATCYWQCLTCGTEWIQPPEPRPLTTGSRVRYETGWRGVVSAYSEKLGQAFVVFDRDSDHGVWVSVHKLVAI